MVPSLRLGSLVLLAALGAAACGGGTPAADPSSAPPVTPPPATSASAEPAPTAAAATAAPSTAPPPAEPAPAAPAVTRTLGERLFAPTVAFMVNYPLSGPKNAAEQSCGAKFPDPAAKAACLEKERGKFLADVLVFEKSDKGTTLTIYRRVGSSLAEISKSKIEVAEDSPERLKVKILGDKGWRPLNAGKKALEARSRDEYSITIDDPQLGQLVYESRIGLLGTSQ